jgi:hypothetical protein
LVVNVSAGKKNFSQRNNALKPLSSCNVTSMVMALSYLGYQFPFGAYEQPEDNLRAFIEAAGREPTNHYDLSEWTNRWMGKRVTDFSTARSIDSILGELKSGRPVVISGTFPGFPRRLAKPLGHIVCLVGAEWLGCSALPDCVIWDDPFGDTANNWNGSGDDVKVTWGQFVEWVKPCGDGAVKWGHFFR